MPIKTTAIQALVAVVLFVTALPAQDKPILRDIKTSLICQCECGMTVEACEGSMACQVADKLTREAREMILAGQSKEQILATFVANYGEKVLSAPTKKGFNLTAWIMPFLVLFLTGAVIVRVVQRWAKRSALFGRRAIETVPVSEQKYERKLDEVLRQLD